jgi:hypothetical protein
MANEFVAKNGLISQNNSIVTGSLTVTGGITGSLLGTASLAINSTNAVTSAVATNVTVIDTTADIGTYYPTFVSTTAGNLAIRLDSTGLTYNPSNNSLSVTRVTASLFGTSSWASNTTTASFATQALSASWAPSIIPSGPFGISNTSGSYTYYTTFSASIAAATSGQTVEMFANVIETSSITITLKNGVNINGNGYTYTLNNSGTIHALSAANSVTTSCSLNNLNVVRTGSTGSITDNSCLVLGINGTGIINCAGSTFRNSGSGCGIVFNSNSTHEINYAVAYATTIYGAIGMFTSAGARLNNSIGYGTSGGYGIRCQNGGDIQNCTGVSDSGYGVYGAAGNQSNSVGISTSGNGFYCATNAYNCVGRSTSGVGFEVGNATNIVGCVGVSVSGNGFSAILSNIYNCMGISSSSRGIQLTNSAKAYNSIAKSTSSYSILANSSVSEIHNSIIISDWNNSGGIGVSSNSTTIPGIILNSTFLLSNASAPYLFNNTAAQAVSTRGNTYRGGGAYSTLITQAIVATQDNQGNIFL